MSKLEKSAAGSSLRGSFHIDEETFEELLEAKKGPRGFMLLSLIYRGLKYAEVQFHQDHIHPSSGFHKNKLRKLGLGPEEIEEYRNKRDLLPNLQLLKGQTNQSKNDKPFNEWLKAEYNARGRQTFCQRKFFAEPCKLGDEELSEVLRKAEGSS